VFSPKSLEEEHTVVAGLQGGDPKALSTLYEWYGEPLYRKVILPRLPIPELAEDCLAQTFARAMERISQFKPQQRSIYFWMRRIGINLAMDAHRRHQAQQRVHQRLSEEHTVIPLHGHLPGPERARDLLEVRELIEESLNQLNPRYAQALRLRLLDDRDRTECAEIMNITIGNFDVLFHRAAKAFRDKYPPR
jgi:RNA polymerase sigma-70 factor (ECF subfamily)